MLSRLVFTALLLLLIAASSVVVVVAIRRLPSDNGGRDRLNNEHQQWRRLIHNNNNENATTTTTANARRNHQQRLTSVHVVAPTNPDDHLVTSLPLLLDSSFSTRHWAGHLPASANNDKYFFYWLFAPDLTTNKNSATTTVKEKDVPVIIWLNGGPACSSMDGLFIENGPFRLAVDTKGNYEIRVAPHSWHRSPAYTLYIDQPVGTGLSFTTSEKYPTNDQEVNTDVYYFLQEFLKLHADKFVTTTTTTGNHQKMNRRLFFSGESYAGHYIPSLMNYILKQNGNLASGKIEIPVAGGAIGNGWTDPFYQYSGADFAYGEALIGLSELAAFKTKEQECQNQLNQGKYSVGICFDLIDKILAESHGGSSEYKASGYDVRKFEKKYEDRQFPPGHKVLETYLGGWPLPANEVGKLPIVIAAQVLEAIHATAAASAGQRYQECTDPPYNALSGNDGKGVVDDVVDILKHPDQVRLLFFNGIHDIVCNHIGNELFLSMLPWEHVGDWNKAERYAWVADTEVLGQVSGYMKEYANLMFLKVMNAGHMVPMDVPSVALDMMKVFTSGGNFDSSKQGLSRSARDNTCPICPTCYERDSGVTSSPLQNNSANAASERSGGNVSSGSSKMGTFVISYAWLVAGVGLAAFGMVVSVLRRQTSSNGAAQRASIVPQYELELRDSTYRDDFDDSVDELEENGVMR